MEMPDFSNRVNLGRFGIVFASDVSDSVAVRCRLELTPSVLRRTIRAIMAKGNGKKTANGSSLTWNPTRMNLAIRGINTKFSPRNADGFRADLHPDLKADFVPVWKDLVNPPFNMSDWGGENLRQDMIGHRYEDEKFINAKGTLPPANTICCKDDAAPTALGCI